jgi:hypothetical protein
LADNPQQTIRELKELVVSYAKQETLEPLKGLKNYILFGLAGAVLLGTGFFFLSMSLLRALQTETGTALTGNWSWVPYAITVVVALAVIGIVLAARSKATKKKKTNV